MTWTHASGWARVALPPGLALCPGVAWAHGGLDGVGALLVGVFLGIPFGISMIVGSGVCALIGWKRWYGRRAAVVGWLLMGLAIVEVVSLPVVSLLVERRIDSDVKTLTAASTGLVALLAAPCCFLAWRVVRRSRSTPPGPTS